MKLILSKSIIEIEHIRHATVGVHEDHYQQEDVDYARSLLDHPVWLRAFLKVKYFFVGYPRLIRVPPKRQYKISMTYSNCEGRFTFTAFFLTEKEAADEFAVIKEFAKRLENKHAMDIISK